MGGLVDRKAVVSAEESQNVFRRHRCQFIEMFRTCSQNVSDGRGADSRVFKLLEDIV